MHKQTNIQKKNHKMTQLKKNQKKFQCMYMKTFNLRTNHFACKPISGTHKLWNTQKKCNSISGNHCHCISDDSQADNS